MRFGISRFVHETNTFAKAPTELVDFQRCEYVSGSPLLDRYRGTNTVIGGIVTACESTDIELVPLAATSASPGGFVIASCFDHLVDRMISEIEDSRSDLDGIILDLHGAMVAENHDAADEYTVQRVRELAREIPIAVLLDSHANVTPGLVEAATLVLGNEHDANVQSAARGKKAIDLLARLVHGDIAVESHIEQLPFLIPVAAQRTDRAPMCHILDLIGDLESKDGVLAMSVFGGFPYSDVQHAGASVVTIAEEGVGSGGQAASRIASEIWDRRLEFTVQGRNVEEAIHDAMAAREGPVVIADLGDDPGCGAPGDGTTILWALLDLGARNAVLASIADDQAVDACVRAGIDSRVEIPVGGRRDTRHGYPIDVRGRVKTITDGKFTLEGPRSAGVEIDMGRTVVLETEARHDGLVDVILTENRFEAFDLNVLRHVGIEPSDRQIVVLKSSVAFRPAYDSIAAAIYEVITPGITTPDPAFFDYQNVRRPIFPLDPL